MKPPRHRADRADRSDGADQAGGGDRDGRDERTDGSAAAGPRALRVLHVVPHLHRIGGCEWQALRLARQQARAPDLRPLLLTHAHSSGHELDPADADDTRAAEVQHLRCGLRRYHPGAWWRNRRELGALPDIVHAHAVHKLSGQIVALASRAGIPSLVKVATPTDVELFATPARWREFVEPEAEPGDFGARWRWMAAATWRRLRSATAFLALNDGIAARLRHHGLRAERLRNGVDCRHFQPPSAGQRAAARAALGLGSDARCIVFVGRLAARKELPTVLAALARLPQATLLVCGDGPQAAPLVQFAQQTGVAARVLWLGARLDVRPALHAGDAFVHASRSEGFPNSLLEAFACGLPAALSDIAGHRDGPAFPGDAALLFPPGDEAALAAALERLLREACEAKESGGGARGRAARALVLARHDLAVIAAEARALYARCLAGRPPGTRGAAGPQRSSRGA